MQSPSELPPSCSNARGCLCLFLCVSVILCLSVSLSPCRSLFSLSRARSLCPSLSCGRRYCIHAAAAGAPDPATAAGENRRHETRFRRRLLGSSISSEPGPQHQHFSALKSTAVLLRGESQRPHREQWRRRLPDNRCDGGGPAVAGAAAANIHPRFDGSLLGYGCVPPCVVFIISRAVVVCLHITELASGGALIRLTNERTSHQ